MLSLTIVVYDS